MLYFLLLLVIAILILVIYIIKKKYNLSIKEKFIAFFVTKITDRFKK